jgi:hypothetical protein
MLRLEAVLRKRRIVAAALVLAAAALASYYTLLVMGDGAPERPFPGRYFLVDVQGERFVMLVKDREAARLAEERMAGLNNMFPSGELARGDGGFNRPWSWHLVPETVIMAEVSIELCDGLPSHVESGLDYWVDTVGRFCPWSAVIISSADSPEDLDLLQPSPPKPQPSDQPVELVITPNQLHGQRVFNYTVINGGPRTIVFEAKYDIQRWTGGEWVSVEWLKDAVWIAILYTLDPGGRLSIPVMLPDDVEAGLYRLVKTVYVDDVGGPEITLTAEFTITA